MLSSVSYPLYPIDRYPVVTHYTIHFKWYSFDPRQILRDSWNGSFSNTRTTTTTNSSY